MPSNPVATSSQPSSSNRRSTASNRHRENRPQTPVSGPSRRRRSRTPDARMSDDTVLVPRSGDAGPPGPLRRKKKSSSALSTHSSNTRPTRDSVASDEVSVGKSRQRHRQSGQAATEADIQRTSDSRQPAKHKRREESRSRDPLRRMTSRAFSEVSEDEGKDEDVMMCGPDDTTRLKKEVEDLKRQIHHTEKRTRKQDKELDKLRKELSNAHKMTSEQLSEIATLQSHSKKAEDLITTIEGHMNCHICMDILARPYGLSPCGHVCCMVCLQEWFRNAASSDPIHSWANSQPIVQRKKICPVCRTHIRTRPIPLFVVKSVAAALEKHKAGTPGALPPRDSPPPEVDPWKGIFTKNAGMDNNDGDEDDGDDEDEEDQWSSDGEGYGGYGSEYDDDSDDEEYQGSWVHPHWEPPNGQLSPRDYAYLDDVEGEELSMLRRGCTLQMIHLFQLRYDHGEGLQALVDGDNTVHLGWNVSLLDHDASGEEFMDWITRDIHERPERWERVDHDDGTWSAWKLVRVERDQEYDDSDSDAWFDGLLSGDELDFL